MKDRPAHITFTPPDNDTAFQKAYRAALTITPNPDAAKALVQGGVIWCGAGDLGLITTRMAFCLKDWRVIDHGGLEDNPPAQAAFHAFRAVAALEDADGVEKVRQQHLFGLVESLAQSKMGFGLTHATEQARAALCHYLRDKNDLAVAELKKLLAGDFLKPYTGVDA